MANPQRSEGRKRKSMGVFSILAVSFVLSLYALLAIGFFFGVRDGWLVRAWVELDGDARASVVTSLITALGIVTSAVVLPFVFQDRIASLGDMIDRTERDLGELGQQTKSSLSELRQSFHEAINEMKSEASERDRESRGLMEDIYSAVTSLLGAGQVSDPRHASAIIEALWEKAKFACRQRLDDRAYLRQEKRAQIDGHRNMSKQYLRSLLAIDVISKEEHQQLLRLRQFRYAHQDPQPADFPQITALQNWVDTFAAPPENGDAP
jgi:hypothetical protein